MNEPNASNKRSNVIDDNLRRVYEEALQEGVPDRFRDLLAALKEQDQSRDSK
jgi:hypothetical protein